jgi:sulfatase maturation enzyme AslB (radical SAM superfamily)
MSNGFNLTKELLNELEGINWHIMISLDGPYHIIKNNISENAFNRIISNIEMIPLEIRKSRIGLKATLSDNTIEYINEIYDFLNSFDVNIIYMSPTHEIDNYRIK